MNRIEFQETFSSVRVRFCRSISAIASPPVVNDGLAAFKSFLYVEVIVNETIK